MKYIKLSAKFITVIFLIVYPLFINLFAGVAMISGAYDNLHMNIIDRAVYMKYVVLGAIMLLSSVFMLISTVLGFCGRRIPAVATGWTGFFMCLAVTLVISGVASQNGLSDGKLRPYSEIYCVRHIPTVIHPVMITVLSVIDSVSYKKEFTGAKNDKIN